MWNEEFVKFLFTLALTAVIVGSLVRYARTPDTGKSSPFRPVVIGVGGMIALSFVVECFRLLAALLK
jgi:hypothetical protein